jgi:hypothetical protein
MVVFAGLLPGPDPAEARDDVPRAASRLVGPLFEQDAISTDENAAANKANARRLVTTHPSSTFLWHSEHKTARIQL